MPGAKDFYRRIIGESAGGTIYKIADELKVAHQIVPDQILLVEISIYDEKKDNERKRTEQQNKYYHKLLDILADYTGDTHKDLHTALKVEFLSKPWIKGDKEYMLVGSTKELTSKNFGKYLDRVVAWGSEQGCILPSSDDYYSK